MTGRPGTTLAEFLVALAISAMVMAAAVRGLAVHLRLQRASAGRASTEQVVSSVLETLRVEASRAVAPPVVRGDTAIDLVLLKGAATPCAASGTRVVIPTGTPWWESPRLGDSVTMMDTATQVPWRAAVVAVGSQRGGGSCPLGGIKLTLGAPLPMTVPALVQPTVVTHAVRFVLYRAADAQWWLGQRGCTPGCGAVQPVTGPLLPPGLGLRFRPLTDDMGRPLAVDLAVGAGVGTARAFGAARLPVVGRR